MDRMKESVSEAPEGVTGQQVTVHYLIVELRDPRIVQRAEKSGEDDLSCGLKKNCSR